MKKTKKKLIVIVMAIVAVMTISGTAAYFTSTDEVTNTWTVGQVKIELEEEDYEKYRDAESRNITPNHELHKDPKAINTGSNDAFVFMRVRVPKAVVKTFNNAGVLDEEATLQELFAYEWNVGWTALENREITGEDGMKYQEYVVVYGTADKCETLTPGDDTTVLLMNAMGPAINNPGRVGLITFKNIVDGQQLEHTKLEMNVETFAIQTKNLSTTDTDKPDEVWDIITAQTGTDG